MHINLGLNGLTVHHIITFSLGSKLGKVRNLVFFAESVQDQLELHGQSLQKKRRREGEEEDL